MMRLSEGKDPDMAFQLGCQTITFGPEQKSHFPEVFEAVAKAGYQGVELGYKHICEILPADLKKMLSKHGLALAGSHGSIDLEVPDPKAGGRKLIESVLDYLNAMGCKILMASGLHYKDDAQFAKAVDALNRSAAACKARGVSLCYHNHAWEFADGEKTMKGLLGRAGADLCFCPDVGWVHKGGKNVIEFLESVKDRIGYVHYKDFATAAPEPKDFVELGKGVVPLKNIARWLQKNTRDLWIVAEQDKSQLSAAQAVAENGAYLKSLFT